jgi:hypothetical protein
MEVIDTTPASSVIRLSDWELSMLNAALNEVCNGVHISEAAFGTRLGATRSEMRGLLKEIHRLLVLHRGS